MLFCPMQRDTLLLLTLTIRQKTKEKPTLRKIYCGSNYHTKTKLLTLLILPHRTQGNPPLKDKNIIIIIATNFSKWTLKELKKV